MMAESFPFAIYICHVLEPDFLCEPSHVEQMSTNQYQSVLLKLCVLELLFT